MSNNILDEAKEIIYDDREKTYGDPSINLRRIAARWSTVFGHEVTPEQVCLCMIDVKIARLINTIDHHDSQVDVCGYAALLERIQKMKPPAKQWEGAHQTEQVSTKIADIMRRLREDPSSITIEELNTVDPLRQKFTPNFRDFKEVT